MSTVELVTLTDSNFEQEIESSEGLAIVDFWAEWCGPCKMFAPTYEKVSANHDGVVFAKVDTEAEQILSQHYE